MGMFYFLLCRLLEHIYIYLHKYIYIYIYIHVYAMGFPWANDFLDIHGLSMACIDTKGNVNIHIGCCWG